MSTFSVTTGTGIQDLSLRLLFSGACSHLGFPKSSLFSRSIVLLALLFCSDFWDFMAARPPFPGHIQDPLSSSSVDSMSLGDRGYLVLLYEENLLIHQCFWMKGTIPKGITYTSAKPPALLEFWKLRFKILVYSN